MPDAKVKMIAASRDYSDALRSLNRQLQFLEAEAREFNLEIVATLIGAAVEEVRERLTLVEENSAEDPLDATMIAPGSDLRH